MILGLATIVCIAVFVASAFALRARMHHLSAAYEARAKTLAAAEQVLMATDVAAIERELQSVVKDSKVMRSNAVLFRTLWPDEYDRAFYAGQRLIAQCSRIVTLSSR
jgi:hypothetical protein